MSNPWQPLETDAVALKTVAVTNVKTFVDSLLGDISADIPKLSGDALDSAVHELEAIVPAAVAPELTAILTAGEAAAQPELTTLSAEAQAALVNAQTAVNNYLGTV